MSTNLFKKYGLFVFILIGAVLYQCRVKKGMDVPGVFKFTDSTEASVKIIQDDIEGYFDQLTTIDMSIQMKTDRKGLSEKEWLADYKNFLSKEVSNWTEQEKTQISQTTEEAIRILEKINPGIFPKISFIKIKTNHYGNHVYYTRGNHICIPENIFENYNSEEQLPVILHEIFHILSKKYPAYREKMYALIGFEKLRSIPILPDELKNKLLTNPDGVTREYGLRLTNNQDEKLIIPLITSKFATWKPEMPHFFDYLDFDLYALKKEGKTFFVETDSLGKTTLVLPFTKNFFTKIKDNTQYIIHPDEIMADNFMLAALASRSYDYSKFSPEGKVLIQNVLKVSTDFPFQ